MRSAPAEKYDRPPVITTPVVPSSRSASSAAATISSIILTLTALRRSGLFRVMTKAGPLRSAVMVW
jgi:hypothetical protein